MGVSAAENLAVSPPILVRLGSGLFRRAALAYRRLQNSEKDLVLVDSASATMARQLIDALQTRDSRRLRADLVTVRWLVDRFEGLSAAEVRSRFQSVDLQK